MIEPMMIQPEKTEPIKLPNTNPCQKKMESGLTRKCDHMTISSFSSSPSPSSSSPSSSPRIFLRKTLIKHAILAGTALLALRL